MTLKDVLIVEDDDSIRRTLKLTLELEGYRVFEGADGLQGLKMLSKMPQIPGLILLDLMMPVMDGWKFCEALRREERFIDIPIAIVTAFPEKGKTLQEACAILAKPIELDHLLEITKKYCGEEGEV